MYARHFYRVCVLLLLPAVLLHVPTACGQEEELPIRPDSIYNHISVLGAELHDGAYVPANLSAETWRADLDTLAARMHRRLPYAEAATGGVRFHQDLDSLERAIGGQTRDQRILSVMRLMNLPAAGTGHTTVRAAQPAVGWRALPFWLYRFADGVYVMSAANPDLIGQEVTAIDGTPIDSVYAALAPYAGADNRWHRQSTMQGHLSNLLWFANPLRALGIVEQIDTIPVRVRTDDGGARQVQVETMQPRSAAYVRFLTSDSTRPDTPQALQWSPASSQQDNGEPNYRISYRDSTDLLYLQFNDIENASSGWTIADLSDSLRHIADTKPLEKVVVDLRTNTGGSFPLTEPLVELLGNHPKIDRRGTLYTLISPLTFSAAGVFAMRLERRTKTIFAGEPSGFAPNIWGEFAPVRLPNAKITGLLSYAYYQAGMPDTPRNHLEPDLPVPFTSNQHFSNVDSTMIAVRSHEPESRDTTTLAPALREAFTGPYRLSPIHRAHITETGAGLHLRVDRGQPMPFIDSDLYPLSPTRLATDITNVFVERSPGDEGLTLVWKDTTYALEPVDFGFTLPLEHLRADRLEAGTEALQSALASGMKLGNDFTEYPFSDLMEDPLAGWPDSLSEQERARRALPYQKRAVEFNPMSWRVYVDLAQVYLVLDRPDDALQALERVRDLYPPRYGDMIEFLGLEERAKQEER